MAAGYEYRVCVRDDDERGGGDYQSTPRDSLKDAKDLVEEYVRDDLADEAWIERREVGPWRRVGETLCAGASDDA